MKLTRKLKRLQRQRLTDEEKEEVKKARSRKSVAYARARREALASGCTEEEAKKKGHEAGSGFKLHNPSKKLGKYGKHQTYKTKHVYMFCSSASPYLLYGWLL